MLSIFVLFKHIVDVWITICTLHQPSYHYSLICRMYILDNLPNIFIVHYLSVCPSIYPHTLNTCLVL